MLPRAPNDFAYIAVIAGLQLLLYRTELGRAFRSVSDDQETAQLMGINNSHLFGLAAFSVNDWTAFVIFIVVIGGIGRMEGPVLGTLVFFLLREFCADWGPWYLMLLGLVAIIITLTMPKGIAGMLADRFDFEIFPLRRRVRLSAKVTRDETSLADTVERSHKG